MINTYRFSFLSTFLYVIRYFINIIWKLIRVVERLKGQKYSDLGGGG